MADESTPLIEEQEEPKRTSLLDKLRARFAPGAQSRELKSSERTRGLVILAGASLACLFLFIGLFTTDAGSAKKARGTSPKLGRPANAEANPETSVRSPVPQLSVNQQPYEEPNELTEQDVLGTMRNRGATAPPQGPPVRDLASADFSDPALAEAYRRQNLTPPPRPAPVTNWGEAIAEHQGRQQQAAPPVPVDDLRKPSLVYVRSQTVATQARPAMQRVQRNLLQQGTALIARLQHGVSSAAKAPVIAVVEYNYEDDGVIVVPAGTKAYGELTGATPQGWVTLKFHTLEFPSGETEEIDGSALGMQRQALRGEVSGQNHGKRFLTRALTGVGTIAAFAVGGRGMSGGIDNSILLRERVASNVALAGEQEMSRLAYQQNIVVTVPANTRFYVVLHQSGGGRVVVPRAVSPAGILAPEAMRADDRSELFEQALRELTQVRDEMSKTNRMTQVEQRQD